MLIQSALLGDAHISMGHPSPASASPLLSYLTIAISSSSSRSRSRKSTSCCSVGRRRWRGEGAQGFEKVEMENPGAYRLIHRQTGDRVIVWGGAQDADADAGADTPIPSHLLLSWPHHPSKNEVAVTEGRQPIAAGFGKLKAQKVRSLIMRSSSSHIKSYSHSQSQIRMPQYEDGSDHNSSSTDRNSPADHDSNSGRHQDQDHGGAGSKGASSMRGWGNVSPAEDSFSSFDRKNLPRKNFADVGGFFSKTSFKDLGCTDDMISALRSLSFLRPSHIQAMAFRAVSLGKSCIIADQSGSGKTLAYLCPIVQCLRQQEHELGAAAQALSRPRCPRVIILTPTAELASQVLNNCRLISKSGMPFRSMVATGGFKQKTQLQSLEEGLDMLIATPGHFLYLNQQGFVQLSNLKCVVLDEVDILYGEEGFERVLQTLIGSAPVSVQYLFVTATLPLDIYNKVVEAFPDCEVIMGPGIHRTSSGLEEVLVDCSGDANEEKNPETSFSNKKNAFLKLVREYPVRKTIVFCNKIETCRKVENVLRRLDRKEASIRVLPFHAALTQGSRLANLKEFLRSQSADSLFLVCTDRASRGIDFEKVDHVVLFDFPREPSEYVRRVGRTARGAGGVGRAYIFVVGKQVSLAKRIIERNRKGHPLHHVPAACLSSASLLN